MGKGDRGERGRRAILFSRTRTRYVCRHVLRHHHCQRLPLIFQQSFFKPDFQIKFAQNQLRNHDRRRVTGLITIWNGVQLTVASTQRPYNSYLWKPSLSKFASSTAATCHAAFPCDGGSYTTGPKLWRKFYVFRKREASQKMRTKGYSSFFSFLLFNVDQCYSLAVKRTSCTRLKTKFQIIKNCRLPTGILYHGG